MARSLGPFTARSRVIAGVVLLPLLALIVVPLVVNARSRGGHGFEASAISTLRNVWSAEDRLRETLLCDADGDGEGEFAFLAELSGAALPAGRDEPLHRWLLSGAFRTVQEDGSVLRSGYRFRVFLPAADGTGVREDATPGAPPAPEPPEPAGRPGRPP